MSILLMESLTYTYAQSEFGSWTTTASSDFEIAEFIQNKHSEASEIKVLHKLFETERTSELCDLASTQKYPDFDNLYQNELVQESMLPSLTLEKTNKLRLLIDRVLSFAQRISTYYKKNYDRDRPYTVDPTLQPCVRVESESKSYPSFHAVAGSVSSCLLGAMFPAQKSHLEEYGVFIGKLRNIVGVHFPTDVEAGYQLGQLICETLLDDSSYLTDVRKIGLR